MRGMRSVIPALAFGLAVSLFYVVPKAQSETDTLLQGQAIIPQTYACSSEGKLLRLSKESLEGGHFAAMRLINKDYVAGHPDCFLLAGKVFIPEENKGAVRANLFGKEQDFFILRGYCNERELFILSLLRLEDGSQEI